MATKQRGPMIGGIGESKPFVAPEGTFEAPEPVYVDGQPVDHVALPSYYSDDQIAERQARPHAYTEVLSDSFDKTIAERRDDLVEREMGEEAYDPRKELVRKHIKPGERPRFLSQSKCARDGTRGWTPVKDSKGRDVMLGNMILASMPEEQAKARQRRNEAKAKDLQSEIRQQIVEQNERIHRDAGRRPSRLDAGLQDDPRAVSETNFREP